MSGVTLTPLSVKQRYLRRERWARAIALTAAIVVALGMVATTAAPKRERAVLDFNHA